MSELKIVGWTSFDDHYPTITAEQASFSEIINVIQTEIYQNGYRFSGAEHQSSLTGVPVFSNGTCFRASMRCWGYIMAGVQSAITDTNVSYMDFYMPLGDEAIMPNFDILDIEAASIAGGMPGYIVNEDAQLLSQAKASGMPLLTTDRVLQELSAML